MLCILQRGTFLTPGPTGRMLDLFAGINACGAVRLSLLGVQ